MLRSKKEGKGRQEEPSLICALLSFPFILDGITLALRVLFIQSAIPTRFLINQLKPELRNPREFVG